MDYLPQLLTSCDIKSDLNHLLKSVEKKLEEIPSEQLENIYKIVELHFFSNFIFKILLIF